MRNEHFKIKVNKNSINDVCKTMSQFHSEFDVGNNRTIIDGKDLYGFCSLDVSKPLNVHCILQKDETMEKVKQALNDYIIK